MAKRKEETLPLMPMNEGRIVHNAKGKKIHILGSNSGKVLPITASDEEVQLEVARPRRFKGSRKRHSSSSQRYTIITETLQQGDTLTNLAARFGTQPSIIKSLNRLYTDQDFYALTEVKVPIPTYGILSDPQERSKIRDTHISPDSGVTSSDPDQIKPKVLMMQIGDSYYSDSAEGDVESGPEHETDAVYQTVSLKSALKWKHSTNTILEQLDLNLAEMRSNNQTLKSDLTQATIALKEPCIYPLTEEKIRREQSHFRLSILTVFSFVAVIGLSIVVLILYFTHHLT